MISEISLQNFKSVENLTLNLGCLTVLIGENGCGKSNILEGIAFLAAGAADKLDNEFLVSRGIRIAEPRLMRSAFPGKDGKEAGYKTIHCSATEDGVRFFQSYRQRNDDEESSGASWKRLPSIKDIKTTYIRETEVKEGEPARKVEKTEDGAIRLSVNIEVPDDASDEALSKIAKQIEQQVMTRLSSSRLDMASKVPSLHSFLIFSPENTALRRFEEEGQIQPLGIRGEGLFKMLQGFAHDDYKERLLELKHSLELVGWFQDFSIPPNLAPGEFRLRVHDRFLGPKVALDHRIANEGFLFLLFYFAMFLSRATPRFFAIDNIDSSLNPKLCSELIRRLCDLAKKYDKQVIVTTHNPAILDGLNLHDEEQRLYVVYRSKEGRTNARRVQAPKIREGETPMKLSDAFLQGLIGGLPKNF